MCRLVTLQVKKVEGSKLKLSDGRVVKTAGVENLQVDDYVKVYADVVVEKVEE